MHSRMQYTYPSDLHRPAAVKAVINRKRAFKRLKTTTESSTLGRCVDLKRAERQHHVLAFPWRRGERRCLRSAVLETAVLQAVVGHAVAIGRDLCWVSGRVWQFISGCWVILQLWFPERGNGEER